MATMFAQSARAAMGSLLATSMLATAVPANAQYYGGRHHGRHHDGIDAGDVIAGAIIIGGLAAILSGGGRSGRDRADRGYDRRNDGYYDNYDWDRYGGSREAIERCVHAVERRGGQRDDVDVRRITDIERIRGGYRVRGQVAVDYRGGYRGDWRDRDGYGDRYGDRDGYARDGYNRGWDRDRRQSYDDRGRFSCTVRYGRVEDVNFRGI